MNKCVLFAALLLALSSASLSAQEPSGSDTPPQPEATQPATSPSWEQLDQLLNELSQEATNLSADSERLKSLLDEARTELIRLSGKLDESRTQASELSDSLKKSVESLASSEQSLKEAWRQSRVELWVWRGACISALLVSGIVLSSTWR